MFNQYINISYLTISPIQVKLQVWLVKTTQLPSFNKRYQQKLK